ncbi:HNH endonuclease family protein [Leifsonia sp. LS-T14]|uniref:HNH endonuclease family protein n=1 Tax=unclassified Leifsonia TaxID=2663824 RepID=UPI0035A62112
MTEPSPAVRPRRIPASARVGIGLGALGGVLASVLVIVGSIQGAAPPVNAAPEVASGHSATSSPARTALEVLAALPVKGKAAATGYQRTADFGTAWLDVDRNGCNTRDDILARDLTALVRPGGCRVLSGTLVSPYTGRTIAFVRGPDTSALVQIDHIVPLQNAWITGAQRLTQAQRVSLANDPLNLLAVDARSNEQKSSGDAATWLPANTAFRCEYVARQISVKATYGLWVTSAEKAAMTRVLAGCPSQGAASPASTPSTPPPCPAPAALRNSQPDAGCAAG